MRVDDLDAYLAKAEKLGGTTVVPPMDLTGGYGRIALFRRPGREQGRAVELIDQTLKALAEPRRREILQLVAHDELAAG